MNKNVVTFTTERGEGKGFTLPIKNLHEGDVIDASKITQRELSFGWASATTTSNMFALEGSKNVTIEIYKGSTRYSVTRYGDVVSRTTYPIPVGTTKLVVKGSITNLDLTGIRINTLDVTKMPCLEVLRCDTNRLTSLDVTKNVALTSLGCCNNQLTSLDLRNGKRLEWGYMDGNNLPLVYFAEGLEGANIMYAYPTEESENNLDDLNAQIWALPEVESASLYIADYDNVIFDDLDTDAIAQAESRGWQIINGEF